MVPTISILHLYQVDIEVREIIFINYQKQQDIGAVAEDQPEVGQSHCRLVHAGLVAGFAGAAFRFPRGQGVKGHQREAGQGGENEGQSPTVLRLQCYARQQGAAQRTQAPGHIDTGAGLGPMLLVDVIREQGKGNRVDAAHTDAGEQAHENESREAVGNRGNPGQQAGDLAQQHGDDQQSLAGIAIVPDILAVYGEPREEPVSITQATLHGGRSAIELLAAVLRVPSMSARDMVHRVVPLDG